MFRLTHSLRVLILGIRTMDEFGRDRPITDRLVCPLKGTVTTMAGVSGHRSLDQGILDGADWPVLVGFSVFCGHHGLKCCVITSNDFFFCCFCACCC